MRTYSLTEKFDVVMAFATIAAAMAVQSNPMLAGFRQRDMVFFFELFANWTEYSFRFSKLTIQNSQVSRYLKELLQSRHIHTVGRGKHPLFALSQRGLIALLSGVTQRPNFDRPEHFFFIYYFIRSYRELLLSMIEKRAMKIPKAFEIEIKELFDVEKLKERELANIELELKRLDARAKDALKISELACGLAEKGESLDRTAALVESLFSYQISGRRPLSSLLKELPVDWARWELEIGAQRRAEEIWLPRRVLLNHVADIIRNLR